MWHKGTGVIQYDPPRGRMKKKTNWWCVINVDKEITRYYRWWIVKQLHVKELCKPSWDAHISVIRGERPPADKIDLWKKYDGQTVEFRYKHFPRRTGDTTGNDRPDSFWFVEVDCPLGIQIRQEFGFPSNWKLHLTVGRTWY